MEVMMIIICYLSHFFHPTNVKKKKNGILIYQHISDPYRFKKIVADIFYLFVVYLKTLSLSRTT
jgi:hypothetical protein